MYAIGVYSTPALLVDSPCGGGLSRQGHLCTCSNAGVTGDARRRFCKKNALLVWWVIVVGFTPIYAKLRTVFGLFSLLFD